MGRSSAAQLLHDISGAQPLVLAVPRRFNTFEASLPFGSQTRQIRSSTLSKWLRQLPGDDPVSIAANLYRALRQLNRTELDNTARLQIIGRIAEPATAALEQIHETLHVNNSRHDRACMRSARIARRLSYEIAASYKLIAVDISQQKNTGQKKTGDVTRLQFCLHRSLEYLFCALMSNTLVYRQYPQYAWRDIHRICTYAQQQNYLSYHHWSSLFNRDMTIAGLYERIVLFTGAEPYAMRPGDAAQLLQHLARSHTTPAITSRTNYKDVAGRFVAWLDKDLPPVALGRVKLPHDHSEMRVIDGRRHYTQLVEEGRELKRSLRNNRNTNEPLDTENYDFVDHITRKWSGVQQTRRTPRRKSDAERLVCLGVDAMHRNGLSQVRRCDDWQDHQQLYVDVLDVNKSGLKVRIHRVNDLEFRVGLLVAIQLKTWHLGLVRWMRIRRSRVIEAGIEFAGRGVESVNVQTQTAAIPGLFVRQPLLTPTKYGSTPVRLETPPSDAMIIFQAPDCGASLLPKQSLDIKKHNGATARLRAAGSTRKFADFDCVQILPMDTLAASS